MKNIVYVLVLSLTVSVTSCQNQAGDSNVSAALNRTVSAEEFEKKLLEKDIQLVDVRTSEEYFGGHLKGAENFDVSSDNFLKQLAGLDKNKPLLVYCLSGGRSASAAGLMAASGFREIYNMQGGILAWNAADKPLEITTPGDATQGLSAEEFDKMISSDKAVLVDYNARWCKPCKKMAPMLKAFAEKWKEKVILIKIDADENKALLRQKGIESIPRLELYRQGVLVWKHEGQMDETELANEIKL